MLTCVGSLSRYRARACHNHTRRREGQHHRAGLLQHAHRAARRRQPGQGVPCPPRRTSPSSPPARGLTAHAGHRSPVCLPPLSLRQEKRERWGDEWWAARYVVPLYRVTVCVTTQLLELRDVADRCCNACVWYAWHAPRSKKRVQTVSGLAGNPKEVVDTMVEAVTAKYPLPRYQVCDMGASGTACAVLSPCTLARERCVLRCVWRVLHEPTRRFLV